MNLDEFKLGDPIYIIESEPENFLTYIQANLKPPGNIVRRVGFKISEETIALDEEFETIQTIGIKVNGR